MSKRTYEELRDMLRHELDVLTKKGEITKDSLDHFSKLTNTLWKLEELMGSEEYSNADGGHSMNYPRMMRYPRYAYDNPMMRGNSNENGYSQGSYDTGMSNGNSYDNQGYARDGSYARQTSYGGRAGRDGDSDGRYSENQGSYRGGRDSYGRYGYSRHTAKERMIEKLEGMMDKVTNEKDRHAIMDCIEELEN